MTTQAKVNAFHDHLDKCEHCRNNPFGLCSRGAALFQATGNALFDETLITPEKK